MPQALTRGLREGGWQEETERQRMLRAVGVQLQVIGALILRELPTRFGRRNLGALWAVLDPVIIVAVLSLMFTLFGRSDRHGMPMAAFYATGYVPFRLFSLVVNRTRSGIVGNRGLLAYPRVTVLDILLARTALEGAIYTVVGLIVGVGMVALGLAAPPDAPLRLLADLALALGLGLGFGITVGAAAVRVPLVDKVVDPVMRISFLISGVFFVPSDLPPPLRDALLWNPMLHVTEAARLSWSESLFPQEGSLGYVLACMLVLLFFGLLSERLVRRYVAHAV